MTQPAPTPNGRPAVDIADLLRLRDAASPLPLEFERTVADSRYAIAAANAVPGLVARIRELEAVTPPELDDARPCPCCVPGCDGNADPRCRYRLCGPHCDEDCGRGDKCPRSDAKREGK